MLGTRASAHSEGVSCGVLILLVTGDAALASAVDPAVQRVAGLSATVMRTPDLDGARHAVRRARFDLALLGADLLEDDAAASVRALGELVGSAPIVVIGPAGVPDIARAAIRAGARDYLSDAALGTEIFARMLRSIGSTSSDNRPGMSLRAERYGKTIGFVGAKGGVGTTFALLNTAVWLAGQGRSVIAAEVQPWLGAFSSQLRLSPRTTLADVLGAPARVEMDLDRHLTALPPGLRLLVGPRDAVPPRLFDEELLDRLLHAMADRAEYVLVDLPAAMPEPYNRLVRHLDHVVVVMEPYASCTQPARQLVERLRRWGIGNTRLSGIAVHKELSAGADAMSVRELCGTLGIALTGEVPPAAEACGQSNQRGVPLVMAYADHPATAAISTLAQELAAEVDHLRLRLAMVTRRDDVARKLRGLLDDADPVRFDVTRAQDVDDILNNLIDGSFDALLLVQDDTSTSINELVGRAVALAERTAVLAVTVDEPPPAGASGLAVGAQDELSLSHMDAYWLSHTIRHAIERRRLTARLEREVRDLVSCETDLRRLVVQLLRDGHRDPRMV